MEKVQLLHNEGQTQCIMHYEFAKFTQWPENEFLPKYGDISIIQKELDRITDLELNNKPLVQPRDIFGY